MNAVIFIKLLELFLKGYYGLNYKTYTGYIILAVDWTELEIPTKAEFVRDFGCPSNKHGKVDRPMAASSIWYDIDNEIIVNGVIKPYAYSEKAMVLDHIEAIKKISELSGQILPFRFALPY